MVIKILGISGSPVKNSNTDRLVKAVLDATGLDSEFVKLSDKNIRPCMNCRGCVPDNVCKKNDDFQDLAEKIKESKALIIGGYNPYGQIDGFSKALLERFWSFTHMNNLLKDKLCVTVMSGLVPELLDKTNQALANEITMGLRMDLIGQLKIQGNLMCVFCVNGDDCKSGGVKAMYGPDAKKSDIGYSRVEDQKEVWEEAIRIGHLINKRLESNEQSN